MKLLWHSNAPHASTGYGQQTAVFCPKIAEHYDLRISSFYGLEGAPLDWNGIKVLPGLGGTYGNEALPLHVQRFFGKPRDGLVVTLMDVWVLDTDMCSQLDLACWVPVDHDPAPPAVVNFFHRSQAIPITMSEFGREMLSEFDPLYCPHGIDTNTYRPVDTQAAREQLGLDPDDFIVGMVAANKGRPPRKSFVAVLQAFAEIRRRHENARLLLHTDLTGEWSQGVNLTSLIANLGIPIDAIQYPDPYVIHFHPMSPETMALVYSAMDVLAAPSTGEGFGIPIVEAQACGTPVIVTDFSAMREVCGAGWKVDYSPVWTGQQSWQAQPHVSDIVEALRHAYQMSTVEKRTLAEKARAHALLYDADRVMAEYMLPALEAAQERLQARRATVVKAAA